MVPRRLSHLIYTFQNLHRVSADAWRYLRKQGAAKFLLRVLSALFFSVRQGWQHVVGRLVELRGNQCMIDGLHFSVDNPAIAARLKSHFFWKTYELSERKLVKRHIPQNIPIIEGGASIGVIACITNILLQEPEKHLVIEANPQLLPLLTENRDRNGCRFQILHAALAESGSTVSFYLSEKFVSGSVQRPTGKMITVRAVTLRELLARTGWNIFSLILDIEGGELDIIFHEGDILQKHVAVLIMEMHPVISKPPEIEFALRTLEQLGFVLQERQLDVYVYKNSHLPS